MLSGRRGVYRLVLSGPSDASHVHDHFGAGAWHGGRLRGCAARGPRVLRIRAPRLSRIDPEIFHRRYISSKLGRSRRA